MNSRDEDVVSDVEAAILRMGPGKPWQISESRYHDAWYLFAGDGEECSRNEDVYAAAVCVNEAPKLCAIIREQDARIKELLKSPSGT